LFVLLYNMVFFFVERRLESAPAPDMKPFTIFVHIQISLDLLALGAVIYLTGGIASPFVPFVIFHIVLAGILLPRAASFAYGILVLLALGGLTLAQQGGLVPVQPPTYRLPAFPFTLEQPGVLVDYLTLAAVVLFSAFLITSIQESLRAKGRELVKISKELETSNAKLTALYDMVKEIGTILNLKDLMNSAASRAATIMGVKACSIKLLDDDKKHLEFASTFGLSEDYLAMGKIDLEKSPINREIIQGSPYVISSIEEKDHFQYPENITKEGITSMLCLPLRGNNMTLGVFCIYGKEDYRFETRDVDFFSLMGDLTGILIERVTWDLTKSWFIAKVAHNLRSPLNAILSMLKLLRKGYLGPVNAQQDETLERCEKRIQSLGELVGDLLRLGRERTEAGKTQLYPVDPAKTIKPLVTLYQNQSIQKGLTVIFDIKEPVPQVVANEGLLEDVFNNLIGNAIKYTPQGGEVRVVLAGEDHTWVRFEVSDTGIGISEDELPRLFSEFFRTEAAKNLVAEGTGLGLVIVKEILDRIGGRIQVKSKPGEGTSFTCLIPGVSKS
jgi:K+-sensing histidine kinase KdpD